MPALVLFGRRWSIGTDDFVLPSFFDLVIRLSWVIATIVAYWVDIHDLDCANTGMYVKFYFCGHFVLIPLISFLDAWLCQASSRGGVMDTEARRHVPGIIYLRILGELMTFTWNISGITWFWNDLSGCFDAPSISLHRRLRCFVVFNLMSALFFGLFWICIFDPLGSEHLRIQPVEEDNNNSQITSELPETRRSRYWERRLRVTCWRFPYASFLKNQSTREGFKEVAKIMAHFVQDNDLVMSDFLVGLVALPKWKMYLEDYDSCARKVVVDETTKSAHTYISIKPKSEPERVLFKECTHLELHEVAVMKHYHKYTSIMYGWEGFVMHHGGQRILAFKKIWKHLLWGANHRSRSDGAEIDGDNWWHRDTAALKEMMVISRLREVDLIYASFHNDYYQSPYCIIVDHRYKSYVVVVRGCASTKDFFTTLTAWPIPLDIPGLPDTFRVHHGFLMSARNVYPKVKSCLDKIRPFYPDYKLVLTGYSMGGGIAAVLAMMLWSEYPDLRVYAYYPPGGVLNAEASTWASTFTTAVLHFTDLIPRLSIYSVEKYIPELITAIHHCKTPKYKVILGAYRSGFFRFGVGDQKIKFELDKKSQLNDGIRIPGPGPELTYSSMKTQLSIPIMVLPGKIISVCNESRKREQIFLPGNPGSYLRIWTFMSVWEQFSVHSSGYLRVAFYRFMKFGRVPDFDPVLDPGESDSADSDSIYDNIV